MNPYAKRIAILIAELMVFLMVTVGTVYFFSFAGALQQFENNVIGPAIVGSAVNLTPPTTMLAALIGGAAAGVPGALIATPLLGAGKALYLESRGRLPERRDAALRRRLRARVERVKQAAGELTDSIRD